MVTTGLEGLEGIKKVSMPEPSILQIERDPSRAPNETILRYLKEEWKLEASVVDR